MSHILVMSDVLVVSSVLVESHDILVESRVLVVLVVVSYEVVVVSGGGGWQEDSLLRLLVLRSLQPQHLPATSPGGAGRGAQTAGQQRVVAALLHTHKPEDT